MLSKRVVASLDFCSPFKFVVVSRPQPRSSISPGARDERKQGAVRPVQRVRGFLNGQYTSLGTSCSPAPGGNQWKRALLVDKSVSRSIILRKRGYIFATVEIRSGISNVSASDKDTPRSLLFLEEKKEEKKGMDSSPLLTRRFYYATATKPWKVELISSVASFDIPFEILYPKFFFCNFVLNRARPNTSYAVQWSQWLSTEENIAEEKEKEKRRRKKMHASVGRLHNCFTKHEFIVRQKEEA